MEYIVNAKFLSQRITGSQQLGIGLCEPLKKTGQYTFVTTNNVVHKSLSDSIGAVSIGKRSGIQWEQLELPMYLKKRGNPLLIDFGNTAPLVHRNKISTILDLSPILHPEWFSYKSKLYLKSIISTSIKYSRRLIAISEYTKQTIIDNYKISEDFIDVIYPACPKIFLNRHGTCIGKKRQEYILAVSSIDPRKNFSTLIKAFKLADLKNINLLIVGSESSVFADQNLKNLIGNNKSIIFTGYVNDEKLVELYQNALFFIYPSFFEGFGLPPLEAMACGCPTIVSNTTSLPEVCGDATTYVDPYNLESIVEAIRLLYNNQELRSQSKQKGLHQVNTFDWNKSAQKLHDIIIRQ